MIKWLTASLMMLLIGVCGCSKPEPSAESVARTYFETWVRYARDPDVWYQDKTFELLSQATQAELRTLAEEFNRERPQGVDPLKPSQMLMAQRAMLGTELKSIEITERSETQMVLTMTFPRGKDTLTLLREDSSWKIELPLPTRRHP